MLNMNDKISFTQLAILAMKMVNRSITPSELWQFVIEHELYKRLKTFDENTQSFSGKHPIHLLQGIFIQTYSILKWWKTPNPNNLY